MIEELEAPENVKEDIAVFDKKLETVLLKYIDNRTAVTDASIKAIVDDIYNLCSKYPVIGYNALKPKEIEVTKDPVDDNAVRVNRDKLVKVIFLTDPIKRALDNQ
jgi:hypothetical protein